MMNSVTHGSLSPACLRARKEVPERMRTDHLKNYEHTFSSQFLTNWCGSCWGSNLEKYSSRTNARRPKFESTFAFTHTSFITLQNIDSWQNNNINDFLTYLDADRNVRENSQVNLRVLNRLQLPSQNLPRRRQLLGTQPQPVSLNSNPIISECQSRSFRRTSDWNGKFSFMPLHVLHRFWCELLTTTSLSMLFE